MTFLVCFVFRCYVVARTVEELRSTYLADYVDISYLVFWDQLIRIVVGIMLFLLIVQTLKTLRHRQPFIHIGSVFKHAAADLAVFAVSNVVC